MDIRRPRTGFLVAGLISALALAACSSAGASLFAGAGGIARPTAGPSTADGGMTAPAVSPSSGTAGQAPSSPGTVSHVPQPGTIVCGPVTLTETSTICVPPGQELFVAAAEKLLTQTEVADSTAVTVDTGASMCASVPPADCASSPPVALVTFRRAAGMDRIRVLIWRVSDGGLHGKRV
jgi:hypothetical protein